MDPVEYDALLAQDEQHWWYRGRRRIIRAELQRLELPAPARCRVLDAGCGSGRTMDDLRAYGTVVGFDLNEAGVAAARARGHDDVRVSRIEELPYEDESFDLLTSLDVIEHTPDDRRSLRELWRVARPGARLLVTVPAYPSLWSDHDVANQHHRRYRRHGLLRAGEAAGWTPVASTYFNSILLPPAAAVRLAQRLRRGGAAPTGGGTPALESTPAGLNRVLELPLRLEAALIYRGLSLPAGLSALAVFSKTLNGGGYSMTAATRARASSPHQRSTM